MPLMRLDKYISDCGVASRREIKQMIKTGRITLNGVVAATAELKIDPEQAVVTVDGTALKYDKYHYFMLNKPAGVLSATDDGKQKTVLNLFLPEHKKFNLFPVGRLDIDTEGLLLITNDGQLSHNLLAPGKHVDKTYYAKIDGLVNDSTVSAFLEGLDIGEKKNTLPAKLNIIKSGSISEVEITVCEGKYHQIKRMFEAVGMKVVYLKRISFGGIILDDNLALGQFRQLTEDEISILKGNNYVI